ncbi:MAG: hemerythrin domain-containing protein [Myxococcota bacterium]
MQPSEVRDFVLKDHDHLRERLAEIEATLRAYVDGTPDAAAQLRRRGTTLLAALSTHMDWEERFLFPMLRDADAWGPARVERLTHEHLEQRAQLAQELELLTDPARSNEQVAKSLHAFVALLRADMEEEESAFLGADLLRDDVVGIDVETG